MAQPATILPPPLPKKAGAFSKLGHAVRSAAAEKKAEQVKLIRGTAIGSWLSEEARAEKKAAQVEFIQRQAEDAQAAGALVTSGVFGTATVEIYENGYVRVAERSEGTSGTGPKTSDKDTPYERLRSIKFTQAKDQSSGATSALENTVGPALAKFMKGGRGLMKASVPGMAIAGIAHLSSNAARKTFLTIATDKQIHTLTNHSSNGHDNVGQALEIAGKAVLGVVEVDPQAVAAPTIAAAPAPPQASQPAAVPTLTDRLRELADLHKEGILSDEEFAGAKAKLLGGL